MAEQYEAMRAHVRANHFPETTSQWPSLGREARLPPGTGIIRRADGPLPDVLFSGLN
jgi:hypothetical protein